MGPLFASIAVLALASSGAFPLTLANSSDNQAISETDPSQNANKDPLDRFNEILWSRKYGEALTFASSFHPDNPEGKATVDAMRAAALLGLNRETDAKALIGEANRLAPQSPVSSWLIFLGALTSKRLNFAASALDRLLDLAPDVVRTIPTENMEYFLSKEPAGDPRRNQDRRIALAKIGYGGDSPTGQRVAAEAVDLLVRRGDFDVAEGLLPFVIDPQTIEEMLITRRYAPLWPTLAKVAGPHLELVRNASVDAAQRAYDEAPNDSDRLQTLVNALRDAERPNLAISYRDKLPRDQAAMQTADERMGWAINNVGMALYEAGQPDEADRLFASAVDAPLPDGDWRIAMKVNRLELLVSGGKFDRAMPLIENTAKTKGTSYTDQLMRGLRYCTLRRLSRFQEAAKYLPDLMRHAGDAVGPTMDYLLCAGEIDKAESLALDQLKNPDEDRRLQFETQFIQRLQTRSLTSGDPSVWEDAWSKLRHRPAITAEFNRLGRDMPETLLPPNGQ